MNMQPLPPQSVRKGARVIRPGIPEDPKPKEPKRPNWLVRKLRYYYYRFKESKFYVKAKHKAIPYLSKTLLKLFGVFIASSIILLSLNLFKVVDLTVFNLVKCVALYYVVEEVKDFLRDIRRGKQ